MNSRVLVVSAVMITSLCGVNAVQASGFDNLGIGSMDMLFDPAKASMEFGYTYIDRNVDYKAENAHEILVVNPGTPDQIVNLPVPIVLDGPAKARATPNVWNYTVNAKVGLSENIDCLGRLNNPGTIDEVLPEPWAGGRSLLQTNLQTLGMDATCSYKIPVMEGGFFRLIGGARYISATIKTNKISPLGGVASIDVQDSGLGWRAGAAFEYPEYAIRASVFYDSAIDLKMKGMLKTNLGLEPLVLDATSDVTMPQGVEVRIQSGIAPGWLAFAGVKWVDWSVLKNITIPAPLGSYDPTLPDNASITAVRHFNFTDGWTVTAGVGHQLTDTIQIGSSLTWDQGIGTSYSDTYSVGLGGSWQINDHLKWSLGGVAAYKVGAKNRYPGGSTIIEFGPVAADYQDHMDLSYDASWNFGVGTRFKIDL